KIHSGIAPKRAVQPLAESYSGRRRMMNRRRHQFGTAKLQQSPVTDTMACRPFEDADRIGIGYPLPQDFAGLVPVDQEDKRCTDGFEKCIAANVAVEWTTAGDQIESAVIGQASRAFAFKPAPLNREIAEQPGEELCARQMHVRVGDGRGIGLDGDNYDVRVGFSDVVLNGKPPAGTCCRRRKSGMAE